jgi:peroxisomal membrane protein 2
MSPLKWILPSYSTMSDTATTLSEKSPLIEPSQVEDGVDKGGASIARPGATTAANPSGDDESSSADYEPIGCDDAETRRSAWQRYNDALERNPLLVKSTTAFFLLGGGDVCGQGLEHLLGRSKAGSVLVLGVDWPRAARFGMFGLLGAPWAHYFYFYLDKLLPPTDKPFTRTTLVKVCIDQGIQAPALLALMISTISILKGTGLQGVRDDLSRNYWTSLLANWKLWLPFSFINLAFVKPTLRVLFVNAVFFGWTIILSMLINSSSI